EAEKVLLKEFTQTLFTVADDVHLNVRFNPEEVKEYRLIGFDNKVGAIKDTLSVVEGGEVGSAYSILVAFEIVPVTGAPALAPGKIIRPATLTLEYKLPGQAQVRTLTEQPELSLTPFTALGKSHQLAAAVILYGSLLRGSRYVTPKEVSWNEVLELARQSVDTANTSQKEFLTMIQQAKAVYSKKKKKGD
ncbi:MAG TPA: YfbK domain-containing protein, partial [Chitinophagaceae bacterium]|nr:YfbK domain-containing protein [Chitinophagaceae bacterium]